jgi:hypothetical protein
MDNRPTVAKRAEHEKSSFLNGSEFSLQMGTGIITSYRDQQALL